MPLSMLTTFADSLSLAKLEAVGGQRFCDRPSASSWSLISADSDPCRGEVDGLVMEELGSGPEDAAVV